MPETMQDNSRNQKRLKAIMKVLKDLDPKKRIAATKWLEGVMVGQMLTNEERECVVSAVNTYLRKAEEKEYADAINTLLEYLRQTQMPDKATDETAEISITPHI